MRPNSPIYDLDNRTDATSARWQAIQNPEECLPCQMSDSEGPQAPGETSSQGSHSGKQLCRNRPVDRGEEQAEDEAAKANSILDYIRKSAGQETKSFSSTNDA